MTGAPTLTFLGAAGTVTGSRFLLEAGNARVLVDCGLFQGNKQLRLRNWKPFPVNPATIDAVVITHAHVDHVGYLPALVRDGFRGRVVASAPTCELAGIVLPDSARLQEEEASYANRKGYSKHHPALPLYTVVDADAALEQLYPVPFRHEVTVAPGVVAELQPAGHILGSAGVTLRLGDAYDRTLFFSGDVGRGRHPILRPPSSPPVADIVLVESTYGNRLHGDTEADIERLGRVVTETAARGGQVVIPSFAVDRTEVVLLALSRLRREGRIPELPVYADSPMALAVLEVYRRAMRRKDPEIALHAGDGDDPFDVGGQLHELRTPQESMTLNDNRVPAVILSASGMATGGRVLHHLSRRLADPRNSVVLAGFQAAGTRGRSLLDGASSVRMFGVQVPVRAEIVGIDSFSVHADADELVEWLARAPTPEMTYVVHGEPAASEALREHLETDLYRRAEVPELGALVRVD